MKTCCSFLAHKVSRRKVAGKIRPLFEGLEAKFADRR
jgi:hypothetical protein